MEYKTVGQVKYPQNLDPEKQAIIDEMARNYAEELSGINKDNLKNKGRIIGGSLVSGASFHPFFNIPYVGTGIGGAMYDAGQGIVEGQKLPEIAKRAGRGFVIGETVGAVPYVGKLASKTKAGQAAGKALDEAAEKFAQTKAYDALMSEFAPAKEIYKKVVLEPSRKIQQQRLLGEKVNPLAKSEKDVLNDLIADESGQPISFYHGTPNGGFTEFNAGSYFTKNPEYAKGYMHPSASYITPNKTAENPALYEVNIDANKIFDTRNPIEKEIFNKEYKAYYSPELTERGLPDWMEAEELSNWLKEKYPKYDTLIVDEGGAGGYGQDVKLRGEAYIPFSPEQVKIKNIEYLNNAYNDSIQNLNNSARQQQWNIIKNTNPMTDDIHTGIRSVDDILNFEEMVKQNGKYDYAPDFTKDMIENALKTGKIKVYSSKPIETGGFITPSMQEAKNYAGKGKIYSKEVPINDVAWIDSIEGQYAPPELSYLYENLTGKPLKYTGDYVIFKGKNYPEVSLPMNEYARNMSDLETYIGQNKLQHYKDILQRYYPEYNLDAVLDKTGKPRIINIE